MAWAAVTPRTARRKKCYFASGLHRISTGSTAARTEPSSLKGTFLDSCSRPSPSSPLSLSVLLCEMGIRMPAASRVTRPCVCKVPAEWHRCLNSLRRKRASWEGRRSEQRWGRCWGLHVSVPGREHLRVGLGTAATACSPQPGRSDRGQGPWGCREELGAQVPTALRQVKGRGGRKWGS